MATQVSLNSGAVASAGSLKLQTNGTTDAVTIDTSQNVGIGTSSPSTYSSLLTLSKTAGSVYQLTIDTPSGYADGNYSGIRFSQNNTGTPVTTAFMQQLQFSSGSTNLAFGTSLNGGAATEKMRIDSSGNLLVGTTSSSSRLAVTGTSASANLITFSDTRTDGASGAGVVQFVRNGSNVGAITTTTTSTSYGTSSDYRLKENIQPMQNALATVAQLKPVTYTWKADNSAGQGFIAHELQEVVPDCVTGEKDAVDADGNPVYQGIDTSFLVATLTAAIQEQQALITTLTARIEALEAKNA